MSISKRISLFIILILLLSCTTIKEAPIGVNYEGPIRDSKNVEFHYDLTYLDKDGNIQYDRNIWEATYKLIENAKDYLIIEMFLFNDIYDQTKEKFPEFAKEYVNRLIEKKKNNPKLKIYVLLDENNTIYGSYENEFIKLMKEANIDIIMVDIFKLKDTFPWYSPIWRTVIEPMGNPKDRGWIKNFYGSNYPKLTLRNLFRALNVKADHRKIFLNEKETILSSANIHDPSYYHENVAIYADGKVREDVLGSLEKIAEFSNSEIDINKNNVENTENNTQNNTEAIELQIGKNKKDDYKIQFITEKIIGKYLDSDIDSLQKGDELIMGMYFLADDTVIKKIIEAANRGVKVRIILDRSRDAFGMNTNGMPNKPVSKKLKKKTKNKIDIKWYFTNNEQYHTKITLMKKTDGSVIIHMGSANFIKKNIRGYIMDANFRILTNKNSKLTKDIYNYFDRLWENKDGIFTLNYEDEVTTNKLSDIMYEILDKTQLGSF